MTAWRVDGGEVPVEVALSAAEGAYLVHLPGGDAAEAELRGRVEAWVGGQEIVLRSERLLWSSGRMAVIGGTADLPAYRAGLETYDRLVRRLVALERGADGLWAAADGHVRLLHRVGAAELAEWPAVQTGTEAVIRLRMRFTEIAPLLERAPPEIDGLARRVVMEFAAMADMPHRLEQLDERIDVLAELYESANDRLSEFSHFHREFRLEWLIVAVLGVECVLTLLGLFY